MTGNYVRVVQYYLAVIGENIDTVPEIAVDGIYGPQTAEAVRAFQREYGLPVTGVFGAATRDAVIAAQRLFGLPVTGLVDVFTWDEIVNAYRDVVSGENAAEGQFGGTTLR